MNIISVQALQTLISQHGLDTFLADLMAQLRTDFSRWGDFTQMPRPAMHVPGGVIELMPICDQKYYAFKYVNGHPQNPTNGKQTVIATGQLSRVADGYPILLSEMTLLTALRTAANAALATDVMARKDARIMAIIGNGAQSEFQVQATRLVRDITEVRYYDIDPAAMDKFARNLKGGGFKLVRAKSAEVAVRGADIVTVCTACKQHVDVIKDEWVAAGMHINGLGGDCPGKTEIEQSLLERCQILVEYFEQSVIEGEIQRFEPAVARRKIVGELHELLTNKITVRTSPKDITLFDSVGIALEDYSALCLLQRLVTQYGVGEVCELIPTPSNPKDLFSLVVAKR